MAPSIEALIMLSLASRSPGSCVARSIWAQPRANPSSAIPSAGGLNAGARKVSMQWDGVHACRSREERRQAHSQLWVANGRSWHQVWGQQAELPAVVEDNDCAPSHLAARAGG